MVSKYRKVSNIRGMQTYVHQCVQADFRAEFDFEFIPFFPEISRNQGLA